jgi:HSP20 family protein
MNAIVRRPYKSLSLVDDLDRFFDSFWNSSVDSGFRAPAVDIRENKDQYEITADLPGMTGDDLDIKIDDNLLTITAEKKSEKEEKDTESEDRYLVRERSYCSYRRSFVLPKDVDAKSVEADFNNGQLNLVLKKKEEAKPVTIKVKAKTS